jgi:hypothetical protein
MTRTIAWIVATTVAMTVVGAALHFPGSSEIGSGIDAWQRDAAVFGAVFGLISGAFVGGAQWLALGASLRRGLLLVAAMGLGVAVTHALGDGMPTSFGRLAVAAVGGLALGVGFAPLLRERLAFGAVIAAWVVGIVAGYAVTGALGLPATQDPGGWASEHAVVGAVAGLVWGAATAWAGVPRAVAP